MSHEWTHDLISHAISDLVSSVDGMLAPGENIVFTLRGPDEGTWAAVRRGPRQLGVIGRFIAQAAWVDNAPVAGFLLRREDPSSTKTLGLPADLPDQLNVLVGGYYIAGDGHYPVLTSPDSDLRADSACQAWVEAAADTDSVPYYPPVLQAAKKELRRLERGDAPSRLADDLRPIGQPRIVMVDRNALRTFH